MVMKKILLFLLLMVCYSGFGQKDGDGKSDWGNWNSSTCYKGLSYRVKCLGYVKSINSYEYDLETRNDYPKLVHYDMRTNAGGKTTTNGRATTQSGQIESWSSWYANQYTKNYSVEISNVCFLNDNSWASCSNNCYAQCDSRPKVPNQPSCGGNTTSNSGNNNPNSQSGGNAQARADELNGYLLQIPDDDQEKKNIINSVDRITSNNSLSDQQMADQIKPYIERAKKRANQLGNESNNTAKTNSSSSRLSAEQKQANDEAERQATQQKQAQKAYEDKASRVNDYMQKGESALSAGNYDEAIANFSQAGNICSDDPQFQQQRNQALQARARAEKAKADAARKVRIEERQKQEAATNTAVAGAATATVGLMALLNDDYTEKPFAARAQIGLGAESMTMSVIENNSREETIQSPVTANFLIGLNLTFFNNKGIQLHLNPYLDYGIVALQEGYQGASLKYGGNAILQLGIKNENLFKLFVEGGYAQRSGNMSYDRDVANGGTSATDYLTKGSFEYSVIRYGGGIMLHGEADTGEVRIKPGIFFEEFSFAKGQRVMSFNLHANIMSQIVVEFTYSKNYIIPGGVINPNAFKAEDKDFWGFKIIRQGLLTGK